MNWIGQHIVDLIARFRGEVYLEDVSTGTIASGGNLGLDSNNKIVKATETTGDITGVVAGTGLSGGGAAGLVALNVDFPIASANLDSDTMHLSIAQTITGEKTIEGEDKLYFRDANSYIHSSSSQNLELVGRDIIIDAGSSLKIEASNVTMYDPVDDGNPTISLGSSSTNRFEIEATYNSGSQTLDQVEFTSYTTSSSTNDGRFNFYVDEVQTFSIKDGTAIVYGSFYNEEKISCTFEDASNASYGAKLILQTNDGAVMADNHILGGIDFKGAEDASGTMTIGARVEARATGTWSDTSNAADLEFWTSTGDAVSSLVLTLGSDNLATFSGGVTAAGTITGDVTGDLTGNADTSTKIASITNADIVQLAGSQTLTGTKTLNSFKGTGAVTVTDILDEDAMGSDSATALATQQSIKAYVDTKYAYSYITLSASAKPTKDGSDNPEWMVPNINKGIYEEDWNKDTGITSVTTGTTTYALTRYTAGNSFIIPHAGILVGFHGIGRNGTADRTFKGGLFHADNGLGGAGADGNAGEGIDYGSTGTHHEFSLRCIATAVETEASSGADGTSSHSFQGPCKLISNSANLQLQAGDALMPAIMGNDTGATDEIFMSMTIILKIPIV